MEQWTEACCCEKVLVVSCITLTWNNGVETKNHRLMLFWQWLFFFERVYVCRRIFSCWQLKAAVFLIWHQSDITDFRYTIGKTALDIVCRWLCSVRVRERVGKPNTADNTGLSSERGRLKVWKLLSVIIVKMCRIKNITWHYYSLLLIIIIHEITSQK